MASSDMLSRCLTIPLNEFPCAAIKICFPAFTTTKNYFYFNIIQILLVLFFFFSNILFIRIYLIQLPRSVFLNLGSTKIFFGSAKYLKVRLNISLGVFKSLCFWKSYIFDQFLRSFNNLKRNLAKKLSTPITFSLTVSPPPRPPMTSDLAHEIEAL